MHVGHAQPLDGRLTKKEGLPEVLLEELDFEELGTDAGRWQDLHTPSLPEFSIRQLSHRHKSRSDGNEARKRKIGSKGTLGIRPGWIFAILVRKYFP